MFIKKDIHLLGASNDNQLGVNHDIECADPAIEYPTNLEKSQLADRFTWSDTPSEIWDKNSTMIEPKDDVDVIEERMPLLAPEDDKKLDTEPDVASQAVDEPMGDEYTAATDAAMVPPRPETDFLC